MKSKLVRKQGWLIKNNVKTSSDSRLLKQKNHTRLIYFIGRYDFKLVVDHHWTFLRYF